MAWIQPCGIGSLVLDYAAKEKRLFPPLLRNTAKLCVGNDMRLLHTDPATWDDVSLGGVWF